MNSKQLKQNICNLDLKVSYFDYLRINDGIIQFKKQNKAVERLKQSTDIKATLTEIKSFVEKKHREQIMHEAAYRACLRA